jgi:hypothetical protein
MKNTVFDRNGSTGSGLSGETKHDHLTRDECLRLSSEMIRQLHKRVSGVRFKEQASDNAKLSHVRALVQTLQVYGTILKDHELSELETRIAELERVRLKE